MKDSEFPPGWNEARVRRVLAQFEGQSEEEAVAAYNATMEQYGTAPLERKKPKKELN